jgi:hypothetical protein
MAGIEAVGTKVLGGADHKSQIKVVRAQRGYLQEGIMKALALDNLSDEARVQLEYAVKQAGELVDE